ncbi:DinB family protein [Reyranella sp.]|uniref:DinB family protein n=1 Tax=Reyranella sp. TaxID=1929291 RepID=UPI00120F9A69|nr:DinB family protein [Reyranella sp.]TAJ84556.1 MAG: damage-inducible protein DinB [Reyranella sp.]
MIDVAYAQRMARYNRWQNENLYGAAGRLSEEERRRERGAFFGSIHATFAHLVWADTLWISRFEQMPAPPAALADGLSAYPTWDALRAERVACDAEIVRWADALGPGWLDGDLAYFSRSVHREVSGLRWIFVTHFFNHQTHHRGQCHCLLTQCGLELQDTDLPMMPE